MSKTAGYVTTHVLDTARGCPAAGLRIELYRIEGELRHRLHATVTNADGRTDAPVIGRGELFEGIYELVFHAGDYLAQWEPEPGAPRFLDIIPIRFGIADVQAHYHVPLLLSPYSYATYRGS